MFGRSKRNLSGQAVTEFALILVVLLLFIFVIIESGRLFQGWLTVQNSARAAARYAITGNFDPACLSEIPACLEPRLESIKRVGRSEATGLVVDPAAVVGQPESLDIQVHSKLDGNPNWIPDYAGTAGKPVRVRVTYQMPIITPLLRPIVNSVRLSTQVIVNNEDFDQTSSTTANNNPPQVGSGGGGGGGGGGGNPPTNADVILGKTASSSVVVVNGNFEYYVDVVNMGPFYVDTVQVVDSLPPGVTFNYATVSPSGSCTESGGTVTCQLPNLSNSPPTNSASVTINVDAPGVPGDITNVASVTIGPSAIDNDLSNNTDSVVVTVVNPNQADIEVVSISDNPDPVTVGGSVVYGVLVRNNGVSNATGVTMDASLANGTVTGGSSTLGSCSTTATTVNCTIGALSVGGTATIIIDADPPGSPGTMTLTASADANESDPVPANDSRFENTTVAPPVADIFITKADSPDPLPIDGLLTYSLIVGNNGPANVSSVQVVDGLPANVTYQSAAPNQGTCSVSGTTITCDLGAIAVGANASVLITVRPTQQGTISNSASVATLSGETDSDLTNNTATATTTVQPSADLAITKSDSPDPVIAGSTLNYTLNVSNNGPSQANSVQVVDNLPANVFFLTYTTTQGNCSLTGTTVTCNLGNLANGASATIVISVIPTVPGSLQNQATVSSSTNDGISVNNSDTANTSVLANTTRYIALLPACGPAGAMVDVYGYNFETNGNFTLKIDLIPPSGSPVTNLYTSPGPFVQQNWIIPVTIPPTLANGLYTIKATRQANQTASTTIQVPCPSPNLTVSAPTLVSPPARAGQPTTFQVFVTNNGDIDAVSQFFVGLYFDPSPPPVIGTSTYISQSFRVKLVAVNGLAVNQSKPVLIRVNNGFPSVGSHTAYAVVDAIPEPTGLIGELSELDNIDGATFLVADPPPPTPTPTGPTDTPTVTYTPSPTPINTPVPGSLAGQAFLTSQGGQSLQQAGVEVNLYSDDAGGAFIGTTFTDLSGAYVFTGLVPGNYTVTGCIDIEGTEYFYSVSAVTVPAGGTRIEDLFLVVGVCS